MPRLQEWQGMLADPEIPIRMTDPRDIEIVLEAESQLQIGPSHKLVEDDPVIDPVDPNFPTITLVEKLAAPLPYFCNTNRLDAEHVLGGGKIDARFLMF